MNKERIIKIIDVVTKECKENFEEHKENYTLSKKVVIPFTSKTIHSRKVSDWGTDEDEDKYIWFSAKGWEVCLQTTQVGAGMQDVISEHLENIEPKDVIEQYYTMDIIQQLEFLNKCYDVLLMSKYKSELLNI